MYKVLATFDGVLIALMVAFNGLLASHIGNKQALMIIHLVGLIGTIILLLGSHTRLRSLNGLPVYLFIAGALGIGSLIMVLNSLVINRLSAVYVTILVFIGQLVTGMVIDYLRWEMLSGGKIIGRILIIIGLYYYIEGDKK